MNANNQKKTTLHGDDEEVHSDSKINSTVTYAHREREREIYLQLYYNWLTRNMQRLSQMSSSV